METSTAEIHVETLLPSSFPGLGGSIKWSKKLIAMLEMFFSLLVQLYRVYLYCMVSK